MGLQPCWTPKTIRLSLLRPGVPAREVAAAHDRYMQARGLPEETRLYCHGQGYDMVERPLVRADDAMTVEAGMCLAVHPGTQTERMFAVNMRQLHDRPRWSGRVFAPDREAAVRNLAAGRVALAEQSAQRLQPGQDEVGLVDYVA